jgi:hypothetical protein
LRTDNHVQEILCIQGSCPFIEHSTFETRCGVYGNGHGHGVRLCNISQFLQNCIKSQSGVMLFQVDQDKLPNCFPNQLCYLLVVCSSYIVILDIF